ncbi:MAG: anion permease [Clostridia bacterium]|nr:anion permease [Clostridia bacterium]
MMLISAAAAVISMFLVPPSAEYLTYVDFRVIALLFCMMAVTSGLREIGTFEVLSRYFLKKGKDVRRISIILVLLCFFIAMAVTNDVALLTMVPFSLAVLDFAGEKRIIFVIVMETIAANLGSMLTPVGNPQNLYLFSYFGIDAVEFMKITFPITGISLIIIVSVISLVKGRKVDISFKDEVRITDKRRFAVYMLMFVLCIITVFGVIDYRINFAIAIAGIFVTDRKIFAKIDYELLVTFICFFIFVGNVSSIERVGVILAKVLEGHVLLFGAALSQIISNVPAAVMLSPFTNDAEELILGVDIGGLGTLVASLASLISYKFYAGRKEAKKGLYLASFSVANFGLLAVLLALESYAF